MKIFSFFSLLIICCTSVSAQSIKYTSPVDFNIFLAGNVGEIRSNHFHSGIDIKSPNNSVGAPIRAIADGYIERLFVSPSGYGKAVYIRHLDGSTSVYGHLDNFEKSIANWVRRGQYSARSFRVDLYPENSKFAIKQGQMIGYLGNSGSSMGPHLHLEIRNSAGEPINIQAQNIFTVRDVVAPKVHRVTLMECDTVAGAPIFTAAGSLDFTYDRSGNIVPQGKMFYCSKPFYLAYEVIDFANGSSNTLGIYSLSQVVDKKLNFKMQIDKVSYTNGRYVNAILQWGVEHGSRTNILRAYVSPNNTLKIYSNVVGRGIIEPAKTSSIIDISTSFTDNNGNISTINFAIAKGNQTPAPKAPQGASLVRWNRDFSFEGDNFSVKIPAKALYETALIPIATNGSTVTVGDKNIPLQKDFSLSMRAMIAPNLQSKVVIVNQRGHYVGGVHKDGNVTAKISSFGAFTIAYDTEPPKVTYNGIIDGVVNLRATDNLSGIKSYTLTIDNEWALIEYDAKTGNLTYKIEPGSAPKNHNISLTVADKKGNSQTIEKTEKW